MRNGLKFILSNNHVLANANQAKLGEAILQPGRLDGGTLGNDRLATLVEFVPLAFEGEPEPPPPPAGCGAIFSSGGAPTQPINKKGANRVDCALARADGGDDNLSADILNIGVPKGILEAALGMQIQKSGRKCRLVWPSEPFWDHLKTLPLKRWNLCCLFAKFVLLTHFLDLCFSCGVIPAKQV